MVVHGCQAIVQTGLIHGLCICRGIHELSYLWTEGEFVVVAHINRQFVCFATLSLNEDSSVQSLITVEGSGSSVAENGHRFHFFERQVINRAFYSVNKDEQFVLAGGLCAAHVHPCTKVVVTLKLAVLQGCQA